MRTWRTHLGQGTAGHAQPLGKSPAGQALSYAEPNSFLLLQRRELAPSLGWISHRWTFLGAWRIPCWPVHHFGVSPKRLEGQGWGNKQNIDSGHGTLYG